MAETIEAFIDKLQADGVQAGQEAADKIREQAEQDARRLIEEAEEQAKRIVERADAESKRIRAKGESELKLAARDTVIQLRDTLTRALRAVLQVKVTEVLGDASFLGQLLHDIVMQYVQADVEGTMVTINVSEEMRHRLTHWAMEVLHKDLEGSRTPVDLHGTLAGAGFEYRISDGTVEVTVESVVAALCELVVPELRQLVAGAVADGDATHRHN